MSGIPARVPFHFHLGGPGTITVDKQFSIYVSRTLDVLGKNQDMVKYRVKMCKECQEHDSVIHRQLKPIYAGSKAEGLTSLSESDSDYIMACSHAVCAEKFRPFKHKRNTTVFQTDRHNTHAGYTKLKHVNGFCTSFITDSLIQEQNGDTYLSSDNFVSKLIQMSCDAKFTSRNIHERSGPSTPISDLEGCCHEDKVMAFHCFCPSILQSFLIRPRPHNRLSGNEIHDISVMEAHVVPVGHKGSDTSHLEWRICFTKAEIYLVQRLNETETKLYIILKMVSKLLNVISKDITSYLMKNIVLWLVELYPVELFTEDLLTYQLIQALRFLQKCVEVDFLPSYMIPERNLLADRLDRTQRLQLTTLLSTLIQEKGYLLLRCEKLRDGMAILYREPDMAEEYRHRRDMAEKLNLLYVTRRKEKMATTGLSEEEVIKLMDNDGTNEKIETPLFEIACPDIKELARQSSSADAFEKLCIKRLRQLFS